MALQLIGVMTCVTTEIHNRCCKRCLWLIVLILPVGKKHEFGHLHQIFPYISGRGLTITDVEFWADQVRYVEIAAKHIPTV